MSMESFSANDDYIINNGDIISNIITLINSNTEYGYYLLCEILLIIENKKEEIDDNVYKKLKADIINVIKNIDPNIFYTLCLTCTRIIERFDYLQAIKKIDMIVYDKLIENIFNNIKNKECTDPKIQLFLLKLLMTDLIDNKKLIQENETLIKKNKELMQDILYLMKQLNLNASYNAFDIKELLDFMIDAKSIHNERLKKELFDYLQAIKKRDVIVYDKLIENIFNNIKNKECTDPKIQLFLLKLLMTNLIDNEKLIQENKTLIEDNKTLMKNILCLMKQLNPNTSDYACYIKELLYFMIDKNLIHNEKFKKELSKGLQKIDLKDLFICSQHVTTEHTATTVTLKKNLSYKDKSYLTDMLRKKDWINKFLSEIQNKNFDSVVKNKTINSTEESVQHTYQKQNVQFKHIHYLSLLTGRMRPTKSNTTSSKK